MERNVLARPSFGGAREESERLDLVEEERGSLPGDAVVGISLLSSAPELVEPTRDRGLKCKSTS